MSEFAAAVAVVSGRVQGVNFRYFVERHARALELTGYVRNLSGGEQVEALAEGDRENLDKLLDHLREGPPRARVDRVDVSWLEYSGRFDRFAVRY
jgi:acylphosphatase